MDDQVGTQTESDEETTYDADHNSSQTTSDHPSVLTGGASTLAAERSAEKATSKAGEKRGINAKRKEQIKVSAFPCNCSKSQCLKLYCDCFSRNEYCSSSCRCRHCLNQMKYLDQRRRAIKAIIDRNPGAFKPKVAKATHKLGCKCKRSRCLKKYCECFSAGVLCCAKCRCANCENTKDSESLQQVRSRAVTGVKRKRSRLNLSPDVSPLRVKTGSSASNQSAAKRHSTPMRKRFAARAPTLPAGYAWGAGGSSPVPYSSTLNRVAQRSNDQTLKTGASPLRAAHQIIAGSPVRSANNLSHSVFAQAGKPPLAGLITQENIKRLCKDLMRAAASIETVNTRAPPQVVPPMSKIPLPSMSAEARSLLCNENLSPSMNRRELYAEQERTILVRLEKELHELANAVTQTLAGTSVETQSPLPITLVHPPSGASASVVSQDAAVAAAKALAESLP